MKYFERKGHGYRFVGLTADQWELYDKPGAKRAAQVMNKAVRDGITIAEKALGNGVGLRNVLELARSFAATRFDDFDQWGASDTEPHATLGDVLRAYASEVHGVDF